MKLIFVLTCTFLLNVTAGVYSQNTRFTFSVEGSTIKDIFRMIEKESQFRFLYNDDFTELNHRVTVDVKNSMIEDVLNNILNYSEVITWRVLENNLVVIMPANLLQWQTVTGTITDAEGEPLPGVNIIIKGTTTGVVSNAAGRYSINVPGEDAVLLFSSVGYATQEVAAGDRTNIDVTLQESVSEIDEVVVVGYGTQKRANLSGAVETVSVEKLESRSTNNLGIALQGVAPSLVIQPGNGQANTTPSYNIRGMTSINGGSPLVLVDGVPTDPNDFSRMNAADIANISILKDASSAAIYGARAAFGVIMVTTRKGDSDKPTVRFNNTYNIRSLGRMPDVVTDPYINASYREIMGQPWYHYYDEATLEYAKQVSENPSLPNIIMDPLQPENWLYLYSTDWYKEVYGNGTATSHSHNLSISGKNDKVSYYLGAEYYRENGMIKVNTDVFDRFNVRNRVEYKPTDWLTVGNNTSLQYYIYKMPTHFSANFFRDMGYRAKSLYPVKNPDGTWAGDGNTNMVAALQEGGNSTTHQYFTQTQFDADIAVVKNVWHIKGDFTARYSNNKIDKWSAYAQTRRGPELPIVEFTGTYYGWNEYTHLDTWGKVYTLANIYTDFSKTWGKHSLSALAGFSQEYERYEWLFSQRTGMITPTYPTPQLATGTISLIEDVSEWALRSGFFRLNYIFNGRYIVEANGRYDGTSRFPKKSRFGFFPSVSGAWIISEESFFEPVKKWVNYTKVRLSYGSLGNQDVGAYQYISTMVAWKISHLLDGEQPMGIYPPGLVSNSLTWEKINTFDIGLDMTLLSNRLTFSGDIFRRTTEGMLSKGKTLPSVLGTSEPSINAANLISKGWELSLGWNDEVSVAGKPLRYSARFILYDSRAFITRFDNPTKLRGDYYEGQEIGELWGLTTEGFFTSQEDIDTHADQVVVTAYPGDRPIEPGDLKYRDLNGDNKIDYGAGTVDDPGDFSVIGNSSLRYNYGLDLGFDWNGWDLRLLFQGIGKRELYPGGWHSYFGIYYAPDAYILEHHLDHWTPENPNAYFPRLKSYLTSGDLGITQTRYLQNAAYMRMKNITLGYTLPLKSKWGMRIYFSGENLFELTKLGKPLDPEAGGSWDHPFQRTYSFGLNITL